MQKFKLLPLLLLLAGCAQTTWALQGSPTNPAAEGELKVAEGDNGNTKLELRVKHLTQPAKIAPGTTSYVVWIEPLEGDKHPSNVGALKVDDNLEGRLDTVTPMHSFAVYVTPEASTTVNSPTGAKVLSQDVNRK
jgi:hypothetical protein